MKNIVYSPDYKEKISTTKDWLNLRFGVKAREKAMAKIKKRLTTLKKYPDGGLSFRDMFGIDSDYEFVFAAHNYIVYRQDDKTIYIVNIYNEREDFIYKLFGIKMISDDYD